MSSSSSQYDPENRFMRCAMEHKMELKGIDSGNRIDISPKAIDIDNRFQRCASENKLSPSSSSRYLEREREIMSNRDSIPIRESRSNSGSSTNKYPNSKLRPKQDATSKQDSPPKQDIRLLDSPKQKKDSFEDNFPSLSLSHSPKAIAHSLPASCPSPSPSLNPVKTPVMLPLRSPQSEKSPKKIVVDSVTSISVKDGKLVKKEIVTVIEEPPPLVITPSKWSDLLRTSAK
jgi:hypothetical protein